jgi:flagellar protein FlaG
MSDLMSALSGNTYTVGADTLVKPDAQKQTQEALQNHRTEVKVQRQANIEQKVEADTEKRVAKQEEQKAIEEVASKLQEFVNLIDKKLQFTVDEQSGRQVVTVTDRLSGDVIRQIPSDEVLRVARHLSELAETATRSGNIIQTEV